MKKEVTIENMSCNHCKMVVEKALSQISNVLSVQVSLEEKKAVIEYENQLDDNLIKTTIEQLGYEVVDK